MVKGQNHEAIKVESEKEFSIEPTRKIWYKKSDPTVYMFEEPCKQKYFYDKEKIVGNEKGYLWGINWNVCWINLRC